MGKRKNQLATIRAGFGLLKHKSRGRSFAGEWAEHKREEIELEERKLQRLSALGKK